MSGIRLGGSAIVVPLPGPPWSMDEGAVDGGAEQTNIWIVKDGVPTRLTPYVFTDCDPVCSDQPWTPRMNPASTLVAYMDFDPDAACALWIVPTDGSATYPLTALYTNVGGYYMNHPCWHPDGNKIVFTDSDPEGSYMGGTYGGQIKEVTYPGGVVTTLWTPELQTPVQREEGFAPLYSPDGTKIAFHVNLSAGGGGDYSRQGLWVMDADGSNAQLVDGWVTVNDSECGWLYSTTQHEWSHDSEWIAYIDRGFGGGPATSGTFSVWKIRPDGTDKTMLADGDAGGGNFNLHYMGWGAWLPDDSAVIASEHLNSGSGISVVALSADGSGGTTLVDGASGDGPYFGQNFHGAYRLGDRIYWINRLNNFDYPYTGVLIKSCALDGSDLQTYYDGSALDNAVSSGSGFEWI